MVGLQTCSRLFIMGYLKGIFLFIVSVLWCKRHVLVHQRFRGKNSESSLLQFKVRRESYKKFKPRVEVAKLQHILEIRSLNFVIFEMYMLLKFKVTERRNFLCSFTPQMTTMARDGPQPGAKNTFGLLLWMAGA